DNIPGVPGVGVKTATKLLKEYGTVANVYENLDKISGKKLKGNLTTYKEDAFMSRDLATINQTSPIEIALNDLSYEGYEYSDIHSEIGGEKPEEEFAAFEYELLDTITEDVLTDTAALQLEMVSENYHDAKIEAIGLTNENGSFVFETEKALTSELFINWLKDHTKKKFMYDAKALKVALLHRGIQIKGIAFDLQLAAYLLN